MTPPALAQYWPPDRREVDDAYLHLPSPSSSSVPPSSWPKETWSLDSLVGHFAYLAGARRLGR